MKNYFSEALAVMAELYEKDTAMVLATVNGNRPNMRMVNSYYKNGVFYIMTYVLSNKIKDIKENKNVALNHYSFVAHGYGENIGHPLDEKNEKIKEEFKKASVNFYDNHVNEKDENVCILKIILEDALVFNNNYKYNINYKDKTATKENNMIDVIFYVK
jgi:general stress protein 26